VADDPEFDPDEPFSLHPLEGEDVLRSLLGVEGEGEPEPLGEVEEMGESLEDEDS
jgi:hypothetical protein